MAWQRRGLRPYFYYSARIKGRVVSRYIGAGVAGDLAAVMIHKSKAERLLSAERRRAARAREQRLLAPWRRCAG